MIQATGTEFAKWWDSVLAEDAREGGAALLSCVVCRKRLPQVWTYEAGPMLVARWVPSDRDEVVAAGLVCRGARTLANLPGENACQDKADRLHDHAKMLDVGDHVGELAAIDQLGHALNGGAGNWTPGALHRFVQICVALARFERRVVLPCQS